MSFPHYLPRSDVTQRFYQTGGLHAYTVPIGARFLQFFCVGGGGAGGAGASGGAGTPRGGGGGGGAGNTHRLLVATDLLPKTLFVQVGAGGAPGRASGASGVFAALLAAFQTHLLSAGGGNAAGAGTSVAVGTAGLGGTAGYGAYWGLGISRETSSPAGAIGGAVAGAVGAAISFAATSNFFTGGAGGAGTTSADFAGGAVIGLGLCPTIPGGLAGSNPGAPGFASWLPPTFSGGSGGGSSDAGLGGNGGRGGLGSGGGGGGGGTTGGVGGDGGDGFVLIASW